MRSILLTLALLPALAVAQSVGDFSIPYRSSATGPQTLKSWAKANSTLWGTDASGNPQSITLSGLTLEDGVLTATGGAWGDITGTPTTLAGYGITDAITAALAASTYAPLSHNQAWSTITSTPTTLAGYGITDAITAALAASTYSPLAGSSSLTTYSGGTFGTAASHAEGDFFTANAEHITGDATLVAGHMYLVDCDTAKTLTFPASPAVGDHIWLVQSSATLGDSTTYALNGEKLNGITGPITIGSPGIGYGTGGMAQAVYAGGTIGWQYSVFTTFDYDFAHYTAPATYGIGSITSTNAGKLYGSYNLFGTIIGTEISVGTGLDLTGNTLSATVADIAAGTHAATSKTPLVNADEMPVADSAAAYGLKKVTFANLKASINVNELSSGSATNGQVPIANGSGAIAWGAGGGSATTDNKSFTTSGTWTNPSPSTPRWVFIRRVGGGGGGGSGRKGAAGSVRCGGGGGAGAAVVESWHLSTNLGATETITVGAGGTGGTAQATDSTNGSAGSDGGDTIAAGLTASGGHGGSGGTAANGLGGTTTANSCYAGMALANNAVGGNANTSGAAGAAPAASTNYTPAGGGSGGGVSSGNASSNGGAGGNLGNTAIGLISGGSGGTLGGNGGNGNVGDGSGSGGGGGASFNTIQVGAGGNGGGYGAGGGGGGAGVDATSNSGAGGNGASGYVIIITYL